MGRRPNVARAVAMAAIGVPWPLAAPAPTDAAMPPLESPGPRSSAPPPTDQPLPPTESAGYRSSATAPTERAMPPRESAGYRSSAPPPSERAMPPETPRRRAAIPAWLTHLAPRDQSLELGALLGVFVPARAHELYDRGAGFERLARAAVDLGLRIDYYPLRWFGFEFEGLVTPTRTRDGDSALLGAMRGGLVLRVPWRLAPLASGGVGALGVSSSDGVLGDDLDPAFHYGAGLQFFATRWVGVRVDLRDVVSHRRGDGGRAAHHGEFLAGVAVRFGGRTATARTPEAAAMPDRDGDGVPDAYDRCADVTGALPYGCPHVDRDADGFVDAIDSCPDAAGEAPRGCPVARDGDGDGVSEPSDRCPGLRGPPPDGCPVAEPTRPEPAIREEVGALVGVLADVQFASGSAEPLPSARATLTRVADVLQRNPDVTVEIVGHTDDVGSEVSNRTLSARRAEHVVQALIDRGVAAERLRSRGAGGDEPIASNATAQGRATNRRVELVLARD